MKHDDAPLLIVKGERIGLGPLRRELIPQYHAWVNDLAVQRTTRHPRVIAKEVIEDGLDHWDDSSRTVSFTIYEIEADPDEPRPVGIAGLKDVDFRNRTAEYEIVIGESDARGRGFGTETTRLVLDYAFTVLSLQNVMLTVYANNPAGIHAYEKAGFRQFGRRTSAIELAGERSDVIFMEAMAKDFDSPVLRQVMLPPDHNP